MNIKIIWGWIIIVCACSKDLGKQNKIENEQDHE